MRTLYVSSSRQFGGGEGLAGTGFEARGILQPRFEIGGGIGVGIEKLAMLRPGSERGGESAVCVGDSGDDVAGNTGVLPELCTSYFGVSSGHAGAARKIEVAEIVPGKEYEEQREQDGGRRFFRAGHSRRMSLAVVEGSGM